MSPHQSLTALETAFIQVERAGAPLAIGAVSIVEGAPLHDERGGFRLDDIRDLVASRLELLPKLRTRLRWPAAGIGRPWWEDDPQFDIANHVDLTVLADGGDESALQRLAGRLFATPLRDDRPLWELRFVTGLDDGRVAIIERIHHAIIDGVSGVDLATLLFDIAPHDRPDDRSDAPTPIGDAAGDGAGDGAHPPVEPSRWLRDAARALGAPARTLQAATTVVRGVGAMMTDGARAPRSSLNAPIGPERRLLWVRGRLDAMKAMAAEHDVKVNDVVLAAVAGGVRELLIARGETIGPKDELRVLVPVSQRSDAQRGTLGNRVAGLVVHLPIGIGDPSARVRAVGAETVRRKASGEAEAGAAMLAWADALPAAALSSSGPILARQPFVNLVVTNVPGPPFPLYLLGSRSLEAFPYVPLAGNLTLAVAVLSYDGAINLGITVDPVACPDADAFAAGVEASFATLGAVPAGPLALA